MSPKYVRWTVIGIVGAFLAADAALAQTRVRRESSGSPTAQGGTVRRGNTAQTRSAARAGTIRYADRGRVVRGGTVVQSGGTVVRGATYGPRYTRIVRPSGARIVSVHRPCYGTVIARPLPSFRPVVIGGANYFVDHGIYYVQRPTGFVCVPPPPGAYVRYLPAEYEEVVVGGRSYYYADDTYYEEDTEIEVDIDIDDDDFDIEIDIEKERGRRGGYRIVEPPVGAYIYTLPVEYEPVVVRNVTYYRAGGCYYRPVMRAGRTAYVRVDLRF